jgi:hypothetical protein
MTNSAQYEHRLYDPTLISLIKDLQRGLQNNKFKLADPVAIAHESYDSDITSTPIGIVIGLHSYEDSDKWAYLVMVIDPTGETCEAEWYDESDLQPLILVQQEESGTPLLNHATST